MWKSCLYYWLFWGEFTNPQQSAKGPWNILNFDMNNLLNSQSIYGVGVGWGVGGGGGGWGGGGWWGVGWWGGGGGGGVVRRHEA